MRYLFQAPDALVGEYGSIETDSQEPFMVGQPYNTGMSRGGGIRRWTVAAMEPSPRPGYDGLIIFTERDEA